MYKINNHIHTPYSFSTFSSLEQAFEMAVNEGISALGINDFFVTDGYGEFNELARKYKVYPLFNIEYIGLLKYEMSKGIRVNDPNNPGRTYFCGKALSYPEILPDEKKQLINEVIFSSQFQVYKMLDKLAVLLKDIDAPFSLSFDEIKEKYARDLVRERHIAQALRVAINESFTNKGDKTRFLEKLYSGNPPSADISSNSAFENELRNRLLKSGGTAFVPENEASFLPVKQLVDIIIEAGGIPCYPVLLDDKNGNYTEFERDPKKLLKRLRKLNVGAVELIPGRNKIENLRPFVQYFHDHGFLVGFGTEHNTPEMIPLEVKAAGETPLDDYLLGINEESSFIYIAHQERLRRGQEGFLDSEGRCKTGMSTVFAREGKTILENFISQISGKHEKRTGSTGEPVAQPRPRQKADSCRRRKYIFQRRRFSVG